MKAKSILALTLALLVMVSMCFMFSALAEDEAPVDIVYDPREVLNDLAGDYGIGGTQYASGSKTTVDYTNSVFSVKAYNSSENTNKPNQIVPMDTAKFQSDSTHYRLRFLGASEIRGSLEIFEYDRGGADRRALWWIRGDKWREEEPLLIFTAPKNGTYDITAAANSPDVKFSNSAKSALTGTYENMSVTFSIEKYEAGADVLASANVLNSATISKVTEYKAAFPSVLGLELKAGDMIVFRLSSDLALNVDSGAYRTETEATPVITLTEIDDTNVAPILSMEKTVVYTMVNEAVTLPVKAFDPNEDEFTITYTTEAANGKVVLDIAAGTMTYTPKEGFVGEDTFTLKLSDGELESAPLTVKVGVYKSISAAVPAIKETVAFFYDEPQGSDWLDIDQSVSDWQWQVAYDGLGGTNEDGFRVAEMAVWSESGGITLAHTDAPAMNITKQDILILNCDKPKSKHAKGALTYVAPEDGLYKLTHTDVMATIGLDKYRVLNPPATDAYTTPVYVSITKDNKIVWPADGKPHKFDPADKVNFEVAFPEIVTAMKKGDSLRIVVEMDEQCKSWMNRVWCDPVVYNMGAYDAAKDLNPDGFYEEEEDDNDQTGGDNIDDSNDPVEDDNEPESPDTGSRFPEAMAALGLLSATALVITKKKD